ncbi:DUF6114 domain-containing protein [Streptomyces adustus]|uniref:DUF6114 domain-containing protein n=1 Tax=Streptomyces adustus TaxID=1609272 RepID=UPI0035DFDDD4
MLIPRFLAGRPGLRATAAHSRLRFRAWRGERPFWAGLFTINAGPPILYWPYAHLDLGGIPLALSTTSGAGSLIIGTLLMALGISLWLRPRQRVFAGLSTLLLALVSFPVANLGGLFLGLFSGLIGGSLALAWLPPDPIEPATATVSHTPVSATAGDNTFDT